MATTQPVALESGLSRGWLRFGLGACGLIWIFWQIGWQPAHTFNATRFILYDQGSMLYAVGRLEHGEVLYRDLNWQYGPLAIGWYWGWAQIGGNTPLTLVLASTGLMAAAWLMIAGLTLDVMGKRVGSVWLLLGLLPVMGPSGILALNGPHGALEMFLLVTLMWLRARFPAHQSRAVLLGLVVGLLQWVRFGPHIIAFLALLLLEGWTLRSVFSTVGEWCRHLAAWTLRLLAGYSILSIALLAYYRTVLPWAGVRDQFWPSHMMAHYAATYTQRWPEIPDAAGLAFIWFPVLGGLLGLLCWFRMKPAAKPADDLRSGVLLGLALGPLYWLIGCFLLFKNDYAMMGHLWLVWPGLALVWYWAHSKGRVGLVLLAGPALMMHVVSLQQTWREEQVWQAEPQIMPNGQRLWFRPHEAKRFAALGEALGKDPSTQHLAVFIAGGGVHYFYGTQRIGRHWWYLPGFIRPWEAATAEQALLQHDYLFVADLGQDQGNPKESGTIKLWFPLPDAMGLRLLSHLDTPRPIEGLGYVMRIQPVALKK